MFGMDSNFVPFVEDIIQVAVDQVIAVERRQIDGETMRNAVSIPLVRLEQRLRAVLML